MNKYYKQYMSTSKTPPAAEPDDNKQKPSKTRIKQHMQNLQALGIMLTQLKSDKLQTLRLPEQLFNAIKSTHTITSNGALRRQHQFIGKLMRELNEETIQLINSYLIQKGS